MNFVYQKDQYQADREAISLSDIHGLLRRNIRLIVGVASLILTIGIVTVLLLPKKYEASALLLIDPRKVDFLADDTSKDARLLTTDGLIVDSEVEIIRSREVLKRVAAKADLYNDPEYTSASFIQPILRSVSNLIGLFTNEPAKPKADGRMAILSSFAQNIRVERVETTYVLRVTYESEAPDRAAQIANLIVEEYLAEGMRVQNESSRTSSDWIKTRLSEVRNDVINADQAVEAYKMKNDIVTTQGGNFVTQQQVADISTRLVAAQADAEMAKARLEAATSSLQSGNYSTLSGGPGTLVLSSLLSTRQTEQQDAARILSVYDTSHLAYKKKQQTIKELEGQIGEELQRIVSGFDSDYRAALQLSASLNAKLTELKRTAFSGDERQVELRELDQRAASAKAIYQSMLDALSKSLQQQFFPSVSARVIQSADPPPSWTKPNWKIAVALSLMLGLGTGVGGAFLREGLKSSVHTARELESATGRPNIGYVPLLPGLAGPSLFRQLLARGSRKTPAKLVPVRGHDRALPRDTLRLFHDELRAEGSMTLETLRAVEISVRIKSREPAGGATVIALGSAGAGEGKSTISTLLAMHMAWGGARVLLVDYDYQTSGISARFDEIIASGPKTNGQPTLPPMKFDPVTGLVFLPAPPRGQVKREIARVITEGGERQIESLRSCFDFIVMDLPPLFHLPHGRMLARSIDRFVLVAEWDKSTGPVISRGLSRIPELADRLTGTIINKARLPRRYDPAVWS